MSELSRTVVERDAMHGRELSNSPFLCNFCEDIKIPGDSEFDMQAEIDVCSRCVRIDRSVRFADFLLVQ
ncbi:MAG: hypothetical protein HZA24_02265 [Nitrospirae bacterium]|nr:hypothetical protein [Nitrospirota bacterium]